MNDTNESFSASPGLRKIVWAANPQLGNSFLLRSAAAAVRSLGGHPRVEPVMVVSPEEYSALDFRNRASADVLESAAREGISTEPLNFLVLEDPGVAESSAAVLRHCQVTHADLLVITTRSRTGPKRWIMGSFAEETVLHSKTPLLVINPYWERRGTFQKIFFPTDFSASSEEALGEVIALARSLHSELTVYHQFRYYPAATLEYAMQATQAYRMAYDDELARRKVQMDEWCARIAARGIRVRPLIDTRSERPIAEAIVRQARRHCGIIAMASHSGRLEAAILGSNTRDVLRKSLEPVWVIHPSPKASLVPLESRV